MSEEREEGTVVPFPSAESRAPAMADTPVVAAIEALLFAAGEPVKVRDLAHALVTESSVVEEGLVTLRHQLSTSSRGIEVVEVAGGWQLRTDPTYAAMVLRLMGGRPTKLSRPALEVLAVIAYRQPVTRPEIEELRGVDSGGVLKTLIERALVRVVGRRDVPGRPLEYGTTSGFLEMFSMRDLSSLPTLRERDELEEEDPTGDGG